METVIPEHFTARAELEVTSAHTASAAGSGDLDVLATPWLVAVMEKAAMRAALHQLPAGWTTVGVHVDIRHLRPSTIGDRITATAEFIQREGSRLTFHVSARDSRGEIGTGTHVRVAVETDAFMQRLHARR